MIQEILSVMEKNPGIIFQYWTNNLIQKVVWSKNLTLKDLNIKFIFYKFFIKTKLRMVEVFISCNH